MNEARQLAAWYASLQHQDEAKKKASDEAGFEDDAVVWVH